MIATPPVPPACHHLGGHCWIQVEADKTRRIGSVLQLNENLRENPNLAAEDPSGEGWLVRLEPTNLEEELSGLDLA